MDRHGWIDERLASVPLFANLDKKHLRQISSLATPIDVPEGKALTKEGDIGHEFIIVLEGEAEVKVGDDIVAEDPRRAAIGAGQPGQDRDQRRLAGAVRAEQAEELAFGDVERDVVERTHVAARRGIRLGDVDERDGRHRGLGL